MSKIDRTKFIGGSDAPAVLGVSPFTTPLDLYLEKRGESEPKQQTDAMRYGKLFERPILQAFREDAGLRVVRMRQLRHREHPWMRAQLDGYCPDAHAIVEVKTASNEDEWGEPGTAEIADYYLPQVQHNMAVTSSALGVRIVCAHVPVLFKQRQWKIRHYVVPRDDEFIEHLIAAERAFWHDRVLAGVPPEPISAADALRRWPKDVGAVVEVSEDAALEIAALKAKAAQRDALDDEVEREREALKVAFRDATALSFQGRIIATYKAQMDRRVNIERLRTLHPDIALACTDVDPFKRVLRIK